MAITLDQYATIDFIRTAAAVFTFILSLIAAGYIVLFRKHRFPATRLVLWLMLSMALHSFAFFLDTGPEAAQVEELRQNRTAAPPAPPSAPPQFPPDPEPTALCSAQAFMLQMFQWAVAAWTVCIAVNVYLQVCRGIADTSKFEKLYHVGVWFSSLIIALIPIAHYGYSGPWCWIDSAPEGAGAGWQMGTWYAPILVMVIATGVLYFFVVKTLLSQRQDMLYGRETADEARERWRGAIRLTFYPLIFILVWIFPFISRVQQAPDGATPSFFLVLMHALSQSLQGPLNVAVYFWDEDWRVQCTPASVKAAASTMFSSSAREAAQPQRYDLGGVSDDDDDDDIESASLEDDAPAGRDSAQFREVSLADSSDTYSTTSSSD